jgi:DNA-binding NarL/FixJ family response regulator
MTRRRSGLPPQGLAPDDLVRAILAVAAGQSVLGAGITMSHLAKSDSVYSGPMSRLTPREFQVLERIARGDQTNAIADELHLSPKTIANLVSTILAKLQARDRVHLVAIARDAGLGHDQD